MVHSSNAHPGASLKITRANKCGVEERETLLNGIGPYGWVPLFGFSKAAAAPHGRANVSLHIEWGRGAGSIWNVFVSLY